MNREALERELRARLEAHRTVHLGTILGESRLHPLQVDSLTAALLPWIVEKIEEADTEARLGEGRLP